MPHPIQINHELPRVLGQAAHPHHPQTFLDLPRLILNLVRPVLLLVAQLQPVERRRTGQRYPRRVRMYATLAQGLALVDRHRQQRIMPQRIVIVEILIAQNLPIQPLVQQLFQGVIAVARVPPVDKGPSQTPSQSQPLIQLPHQQNPAVVRQITPRKIGLHFA